MTADEALSFLNKFLKPDRLSDIQNLVFRLSWMGQTYGEIAIDTGYDPGYIKVVGYELWQLLSEVLGVRITKKNAQFVLRNFQTSEQSPELLAPSRSFFSGSQPAPLEFPGGPVPLNSVLYIERSPIEERCYAEIGRQGSLIRINAPSQMGKTSLVHRILAQARQIGLRTVLLNLQQADAAVFADLNKFLRWFCTNVSRQLQLEAKLDVYWDEEMGLKMSCTSFFENYLLASIDSPIALALDEVNRIFEYPDLSRDFLPLLRSWHESAAELEIWRKLRLVIACSTEVEVYVPLNANQSPFNVGLPISLSEFTLAQVQELARRYGLDGSAEGRASLDLEPLVALVGGHPYLVRLALEELRRQPTLEQLLQEAPTQAGIYRHHLRSHLRLLQAHPDLWAAFRQIVLADEGVQLAPLLAYRLESLGLVRLNGNQALPRYELYRQYFSSQLQIADEPEP